MINNVNDGAGVVQQLLENRGISTQSTFLQTGSKGVHIQLHEKIVHHVKFSKKPFEKFGVYFKGFNCMGDSLDDKVVQALPDDSVLYFSYPTKIYMVKFSEFLSPHFIRKHSKTGVTAWCYPHDWMEVIYSE